MYNIALLPGDGIGPEVIKEAKKVLYAIQERFGIKFNFKEGSVGGAAYEVFGAPLPDDTLNLVKDSDAVLFGAVGGPKWDHLKRELRPEQAILKLRKELNLFANLRPAVCYRFLADSSPLKNNIISGNLDLLIVRELTGGLYFGTPRGRENTGQTVRAFDTMVYTSEEIKRVARVAFEAARKRRKKVTSVDKANVLETSKLWREVVDEVSKEYPDVELSHMYVDNCAMQLVLNPGQFDVILTENTFGDILSDEASVLTGSIGMLPSASIGEKGPFLYEPCHGSAPDIAGKGIANPIACILSAAMMLEYSFDEKEAAMCIKDAVEKSLELGYRTYDIKEGEGKVLATSEMGDVIKKIILGL
ncbi:3-isopropylmalate dehydrogenase [Thermovenabulum gondwanense]|uniref:3-isopropylmalate dehydrogenase n=1 Tax=Thermovenabulum gondwanense TaxID=520767 RepID=A0A162MX69_9FIRM|nr:3-isopropylmalate dehydrogenase [Thermovenabulum gondwanense]KYO68065.1 3-isopropylmalate dehydrogenase [Thermovenabulum gondwanense]